MNEFISIDARHYSDHGIDRLVAKVEAELGAKAYSIRLHNSIGLASCMAGRGVQEFAAANKGRDAARIAEACEADAIYCNKAVWGPRAVTYVFVRRPASASEAGRKGGQAKTAAKAAAAKANGAKGGRPAVKGWTLVESWDRLESDPELSCLCAIVERDGRRVLLAQARGHEIMPSDWELGVACELLADDTRAALAEDWNESTTTLDAVLEGYDEARPLLDWSGKTIAAVAKTAGL